MVEVVRFGCSPEEMEREREPSNPAMRNWVRQVELDEGRRADGLTTAECLEFVRRCRQVSQLLTGRGILSKAAAWFTREMSSIPSGSSNS
jgi:transposase